MIMLNVKWLLTVFKDVFKRIFVPLVVASLTSRLLRFPLSAQRGQAVPSAPKIQLNFLRGRELPSAPVAHKERPTVSPGMKWNFDSGVPRPWSVGHDARASVTWKQPRGTLRPATAAPAPYPKTTLSICFFDWRVRLHSSNACSSVSSVLDKIIRA